MRYKRFRLKLLCYFKSVFRSRTKMVNVVVWLGITATTVLFSISLIMKIRKPTLATQQDGKQSELISSNRTIKVIGNDILMDGQPFHIISGSFHYFRTPAEYWRDRLRKMKGAGLNAVSTYVEWSFHEPEERQYNFNGDRNIAEFVRIAAEEGLYVLLRPGPYICAERDLGGLPYWLGNNDPKILIRTTDKTFIKETERWMKVLFKQLVGLLYGQGGPIIMVQIDNAYGTFGTDRKYMPVIRDIISSHVQMNSVLYTTDGILESYYLSGAVPGTVTALGFGGIEPKDIALIYSRFRKYMPRGPLFASEFYTGWISNWGAPTGALLPPGESITKALWFMLHNNIHVNMYMFAGGTNFEFSAGANSAVHPYIPYDPFVTSYDYNAPITEAGDLTPQYYDIRETIMTFKNQKIDRDTQKVVQSAPKGSYGTVIVRPRFNLLSDVGRAALGKKHADVTGPILPTFEELKQRSGLMLYETTLEAGTGLLIIEKPRDLVFVHVDGVPKGTIKRKENQFVLQITSNNYSVLSLLVENQGRINFGPSTHDCKGILSEVRYLDKVLNGTWKITGYPLEQLIISRSLNDIAVGGGATLLEGEFTLHNQTPLDTFLDTSGWGKGYIWINGHNLGRYWPSMGPQVTLYVPGVLLKPAPEQNHLIVLELQHIPQQMNLTFIDYPILNRTDGNNGIVIRLHQI